MDRPLRIAMVTEYAYPLIGGISEHVHFLSRELVAQGHDVTVVTGRIGTRAAYVDVDAAAERDHGYRTRRIGWTFPVPQNESIARFTCGPGLTAAMRRELAGMDVVHAQGLASPMLALLATKISRAPVTVGTFHTYVRDEDYWGYRLAGPTIRRALERLDRRIAVSQACIDSLSATFPGVYDIIPNGVDCDRFRPLGDGEVLPDGPPRILFVGRLEPRNALADLLRAAALLQADGRDFVIQVAGDGPTRDANGRLARRLGVEDRVQWLGAIHDELPRYYREATVMAAPCTLASFGVVLIEALASGTPIVCADNVGFRQVIRNGAPGQFVPMRDPSGLAAGLREVLDDAEGRSRWAHIGRAVARDRYDWATVAQEVSRLYFEVLDDGVRAPSEVEAGRV